MVGVLEVSGYTLVYLGVGVGVPAMVYAVRTGWAAPTREALVDSGKLPASERGGPGAGGPWLVVALLSAGIDMAVAMPWLRGTGVEGSTVQLAGWSGLDPISVAVVLAGAFILMTTGSAVSMTEWFGELAIDRPADALVRLRAAAAVLSLCVLAVVGGNVMIQLAVPEGSRLVWGAWACLACATADAALCAGLWRRASSGSPAPLRSPP